MSRGEKAFCLFYVVYIAIYIPTLLAFAFVFSDDFPSEKAITIIIPFHILGILLGLALYVIVIRDIYKREFDDPNTKVTWTILYTSVVAKSICLPAKIWVQAQKERRSEVPIRRSSGRGQAAPLSSTLSQPSANAVVLE